MEYGSARKNLDSQVSAAWASRRRESQKSVSADSFGVLQECASGRRPWTSLRRKQRSVVCWNAVLPSLTVRQGGC